MNTKRQKFVNFRVSDSENEQLLARIKNSGLNKQQFLVRAVLGKSIPNEKLFQELLVEIKKQGVNLNQIARACNRGNVEAEQPRIKEAVNINNKVWKAVMLLINTEYQGVDLTRLSEACKSLEGSKEEQDQEIVKELKNVWQFLKL